MKNERGKTAGFPAPLPARDRPWTCEGVEFSMHGIGFHADGTFGDDGSQAFDWQDEFYGPLGDVVLSKEAGPNGHLQLQDRSVVWVNHDTPFWYTATVLALPAPLVKYDPPPPEPKQLTLILSFFGETDRQRNQEPWFVALPGGAFECNGVCFDADSEIDFTNPTMGETVRRKAGSGVVCIDDQMTRTVLIYAKAGWKRILGHPSGWFQIKTAHGKVKSMNCWSECFIWSIWPKLFILGFTLSFWPIALFTLPVVFFLHYTIAVRVPT